jgi:hypothetical protein
VLTSVPPAPVWMRAARGPIDHGTARRDGRIPSRRDGRRSKLTAATPLGNTRGTPVQDSVCPHVYLGVWGCRGLTWANTACRPLTCGGAQAYERTLNPLL